LGHFSHPARLVPGLFCDLSGTFESIVPRH
jgi:hypothetical protein